MYHVLDHDKVLPYDLCYVVLGFFLKNHTIRLLSNTKRDKKNELKIIRILQFVFDQQTLESPMTVLGW